MQFTKRHLSVVSSFILIMTGLANLPIALAQKADQPMAAIVLNNQGEGCIERGEQCENAANGMTIYQNEQLTVSSGSITIFSFLSRSRETLSAGQHYFDQKPRKLRPVKQRHIKQLFKLNKKSTAVAALRNTNQATCPSAPSFDSTPSWLAACLDENNDIGGNNSAITTIILPQFSNYLAIETVSKNLLLNKNITIATKEQCLTIANKEAHSVLEQTLMQAQPVYFFNTAQTEFIYGVGLLPSQCQSNLKIELAAIKQNATLSSQQKQQLSYKIYLKYGVKYDAASLYQ